MSGKVGQSGPVGNQHGVRHGYFGYLSTGRLPPKAQHVRRLATMFRNQLEGAVVDRHGRLTLTRAALVQSATRHEIRCQLLVRWLRVADGELTTDQRLTILRDLGRATNDRDAVLRDLDLDRPPDAIDVAAVLTEIHREQAAQHRAGRGDHGEDDQNIGQEGLVASACDSSNHEASQEGSSRG